MPRPKGTPNKDKDDTIKYQTIKEVKLPYFNDPEKYTLKRVYLLCLNMGKKLERDPTAVDAAKYVALLEKLEELVKKRKKNDAGKRVDTRTVEKDGNPFGSADVGSEEPFGMGT